MSFQQGYLAIFQSFVSNTMAHPLLVTHQSTIDNSSLGRLLVATFGTLCVQSSNNFFSQLIQTSEHYLARALLPTMPDNPFEMASQAGVGITKFYSCACGFVYGGMCSLPLPFLSSSSQNSISW